MDQLFLELLNKRGVKFCLLREKDEVEPDRVSKHRVGLRGRGVEMLRRLCLEPLGKDRESVGVSLPSSSEDQALDCVGVRGRR